MNKRSNYDEEFKEIVELRNQGFKIDDISKIMGIPRGTISCRLSRAKRKGLVGAEDERIRKEIISALKFANDGGIYDKHIAYLEKQKENPKNADSIPEDCASLAKCEERNSKYGVFPEDVIVVARACEKLEAPEDMYKTK